MTRHARTSTCLAGKESCSRSRSLEGRALPSLLARTHFPALVHTARQLIACASEQLAQTTGRCLWASALQSTCENVQGKMRISQQPSRRKLIFTSSYRKTSSLKVFDMRTITRDSVDLVNIFLARHNCQVSAHAPTEMRAI